MNEKKKNITSPENKYLQQKYSQEKLRVPYKTGKNEGVKNTKRNRHVHNRQTEY